MIRQGTTVSIAYSLTLDSGEVVDSNVDQEPLVYTHGNGEIISGLETAMTGMKNGERKKILVSPKDGYGAHDPEALIEVPKTHLPPDARVIGAQVGAEGPQGQQIDGIVREVKEETVLVDFNHPLAGKKLHFDVTVLDIRK